MKNLFKILAVLSAMTLFVACSDDDDPTDPTPTAAGELTVKSQFLSQNRIIVENVTFKEDGWIVVHADNNNQPLTPDIISVAVPVEAGTHEDVVIPLSEDANMLSGNTKVWVMLHTDDGVKGQYEFDGVSGTDGPLKDLDSNVIMSAITLQPATITSDAQSVTNKVSIVSVTAAVDGWLVIHNDDGNGNMVVPGIIGRTKVSAGLNQNVEVTLNQGVIIEPGQKLFPMLHIDNGEKDKYEFPSADPAEVFGFDEEGNPIVIFTEIDVL